MSDISKLYTDGTVNGWAGKNNPDLVKSEFDLLKDDGSFKDLKIFSASRDTKGKKLMLYDVVRKVLGKDTENYGQEIGDPFRAGTMVTMADGSEKAIELLQIGDKVVNHKNEIANVTRIIKKKFTGNMVTIKLKGWHRELTATETHHGMILPYTQSRFKYSHCERMKFGNLNIGDFMLIPYGLEQNKDIILDLSNYVNDVEVDNQFIFNTKYKHKINRFVKVDNKFARFIGLFLAEGGCSKNGQVSLSFHVKEQFYIQECISYFKEIFGVDAKIHKTGNDNCRRVSINSFILKEFLQKLIGNDLWSKKIPSIFYTVSRSIKMDLLKGWLDGDGYKHFNKRAFVIGYTSSNQLGNDILRLAVSCKLNPKSWDRLRKTRARVKNTEIAFYGTEVHELYENSKTLNKVKKITCNNTPYGFARKITNIIKEYVVDEEVYCITTENEFTAVFNGIAQYQCVSFGAKNAIEYLMATEKLMKGDREEWNPIFPPYLYGTGRVFIGRGQLDGSDGSLGSWMADAVIKFGVLRSNFNNVPPYSGRIASKWGDRPGPPTEFVNEAKLHPVKSAALIKSWDDLRDAIVNGYPCTTASDIGYNMEPSSDGFHRQTDSWGHQMCVIGIDDGYKNGSDPYAIILNSWGDCHGNLKDFDTGDNLPVGVLRVRRKDMEKHIRQEETFAYSNFDGFPEQLIDKKLFMLI